MLARHALERLYAPRTWRHFLNLPSVPSDPLHRVNQVEKRCERMRREAPNLLGEIHNKFARSVSGPRTRISAWLFAEPKDAVRNKTSVKRAYGPAAATLSSTDATILPRLLDDDSFVVTPFARRAEFREFVNA